jgi:flagellar basal-body rod protein FlgC
MKVSYLAGMEVSASGLAAQRAAMNAAAENLANAQTTRTESGEPYRRKVASFSQEAVNIENQTPGAAPAENLALTQAGHLQAASEPPRLAHESVSGVKAAIQDDMSEFPQVYDPGHPDADENGMVRMPNVDTAREMVTMMAASRAYEANIAALQAARRLVDSSLNLAR